MKKHWTPEKDKYLIENIEKLSCLEIGKEVDFCVRLVRKRARELGFSENLKNNSKNNGFKKGNQSHTKGKKLENCLSYEGLKRVKATQFKNGHTPTNKIPDILKEDHRKIIKLTKLILKHGKG